jgi:F0F1-type ATP synthase assembly protein I
MRPEDPQNRLGNSARWLRAGLQVSTVGLTLVLSIVIGFGMGLGLDHVFHTRFDNNSPVGWFTIVFTLLGIVAGFREMFRTVIRLSGDEDQR